MVKVHGHMKIVRRVPVLALRLNNVPRRELSIRSYLPSSGLT